MGFSWNYCNIDNNNTNEDINVVPFKLDRSTVNDGASSQGPKYPQYKPNNNNNNNDNNGIAEFFKNCVIL